MDQLIYAHRGASARFAEHTRAAYLQAIADGADGVECDVHLTKDLQVVCLHDFTLDRTTDGAGPVHERTLAELRGLDVHSWKGVAVPPEYGSGGEQLVSLADLVEILRGAGRPIGIAVELKHPSPFGRQLEDEVLALLTAAGWDAATSRIDDVAVSFMSFDAGAVARIGETVGVDHLCALTEKVQDVPPGMVAGPWVRSVRETPDTVREAIAEGTRFRVWTVDEPEDVELMRRLGVQEITTNRPAEVRAQLDGAD